MKLFAQPCQFARNGIYVKHSPLLADNTHYEVNVASHGALLAANEALNNSVHSLSYRLGCRVGPQLQDMCAPVPPSSTVANGHPTYVVATGSLMNRGTHVTFANACPKLTSDCV